MHRGRKRDRRGSAGVRRPEVAGGEGSIHIVHMCQRERGERSVFLHGRGSDGWQDDDEPTLKIEA
jgi:hypothetical protein